MSEPDDAILAGLFRRVLGSGDIFVILEPVAGDRHRFVLDGTLHDLSEKEIAAVDRVYEGMPE